MEEKYKLYLGDTRKVVAEMVEREGLVDMIPFNINFTEKRIGYIEETGECYIQRKN